MSFDGGKCACVPPTGTGSTVCSVDLSFTGSGSVPVPSSVVEPQFGLEDADPIIVDHAVHWLVCIETYRVDRQLVVANVYELIYSDVETCIYKEMRGACKVIVGFRGTSAMKDLYDDLLLSLDRVFPRSREAISLVETLLFSNPRLSVELTGHSLGGAIARVTGQALSLRTVTFNAAAPPSAPVESHALEVDYHIKFDVISAWQGPNTVRIDKGYWPIPPLWARYTVTEVYMAFGMYYSFPDLFLSHELSNFSKGRVGSVIPTAVENKDLQLWFNSLPSGLRDRLRFILFGITWDLGWAVGLPSLPLP